MANLSIDSALNSLPETRDQSHFYQPSHDASLSQKQSHLSKFTKQNFEADTKNFHEKVKTIDYLHKYVRVINIY